jgi:hypothetical protein
MILSLAIIFSVRLVSFLSEFWGKGCIQRNAIVLINKLYCGVGCISVGIISSVQSISLSVCWAIVSHLGDLYASSML